MIRTKTVNPGVIYGVGEGKKESTPIIVESRQHSQLSNRNTKFPSTLKVRIFLTFLHMKKKQKNYRLVS